MHVEIQVALNFVISYLYNKLPRRRVNLFGEELERALREKFNGHWYPEKPMRGSAYRCIKTGTGSIDPVLDMAARESGIPVQDVLENLPQDMAVWVDPGEVSYRIGEKGAVRILYNESMAQNNVALSAPAPNSCGSSSPDDDLDTEVRKTFNPDAQCFRPIQNALGNLTISCPAAKVCLSPYQNGASSPPPVSQQPPSSSRRASSAPPPPPQQQRGSRRRNSNSSRSSSSNNSRSKRPTASWHRWPWPRAAPRRPTPSRRGTARRRRLRSSAGRRRRHSPSPRQRSRRPSSAAPS
ncbi:Hypothetical predicted protein [Cloeon dipterum]|uniref:Anti-proliferative protein domain-containing protein n=1 Tax=Cloeon dipterum TaxID=197152 RepID=A0A8S1BWY8_9INSE|nr:Hypothetical predicted protein [Cloeon dipterum]